MKLELRVNAAEFIFLRSKKVDHKVRFKEIWCLEGWRNSVKIFREHDVLLVTKTLSAMEAELPETMFIRVYKSFIVAIDKIMHVENNKIDLQTMTVPIGKYYKKDVESMVATHRIREN